MGWLRTFLWFKPPWPQWAKRCTVPAMALVFTGLALFMPGYERIKNSLDDAALRWVARPSTFNETVVLDIDDASLHALNGRFGPWPYPRDIYALVLEYLRDVGAKLIVFDLAFGEPRAGDAAFAAALSKKADTVLAVSGQRLSLELTSLGVDPPASGHGQAYPEHLSFAVSLPKGSASWPAMTLPTPQLLAPLGRIGSVGVISMPLDADRHLRRLSMLHDSRGRLFPALPLAAHLMQHSPTDFQFRPGQSAIDLGPYHWPIDAQGKALLILPSNAAELPTVPFSRVVQAALGDAAENTALHAHLQGRVVFIGSSAFLGDMLSTPHGDLSGTGVLANAYDSLLRSQVARTAPWPWQAAYLLLALLPAAGCLQPHKKFARQQVLISALVALGLGVFALCALSLAQLQISVLPGLLILIFSWIFYGLARRQKIALFNQRLNTERLIADAANAAKSQFLAHVSHELRTPLNAVLGMADVLMRTDLTNEQRRYVDIFQHAGSLLASLLDDLLDLSKIEADRLQLNLHSFSLRALVAEQIEWLKPKAVAKGIALTYRIEPQVIDVVLGDAKRLTQIAVNLISNAIKFTTEGGVHVAVTPDEQGHLCFSIRDTGIGIAPHQIELIFQPFMQADAGVSRYYGGTGLGLSISKRLIELMQGKIWVESEPGMGSTFRFSLPLPPSVLACTDTENSSAQTAATFEDQQPKKQSTSGLDRRSDAAQGVCILLAEDNELNVLVIEAMLQKTAHTLVVASNGKIAVDFFKNGCYGLILMDVQMPVMDGLEACRIIRQFEAQTGQPRTAIVALTAGAYRQDEQLSREAGCDAHIGKPVAQQHLLEAIATLGVVKIEDPITALAKP
jgi:signal transduction histidine kinase/CheY-like chemotaxis protein